MKKILAVFERDIKSILKNPIALIITVGVCIIPALYAWVNIKACWDPYGNTGSMKVAVVNSDLGAEFQGKQMNVGDQIIEQLKENDALDWQFVSAKDADMGVVDGTYFATIEIPEDFTQDLISIATSDTKKPQITYKLDTKANPVAGKISGVAEETLVNQITTEFISTVNSTVFEKIGDYANKVNKNDLIDMKHKFVSVSKNIDTIIEVLQNINTNSKELGNYIAEMEKVMPTMTDSLSDFSNNNEGTSRLLGSVESLLTASINNLESNLNSANSNIKKTSQQLSDINNNMSKSDITNDLYQANNNIQTTKKLMDSSVSFLSGLNNTQPNDEVSNLIANLKNYEQSLEDLEKVINDQINKIIANNIDFDQIKEISNTLNTMQRKIESTISQFNKSTVNALNSIKVQLSAASNDANTLLKAFDRSDKPKDTLKNGQQATGTLNKISGDLADQLSEYKDEIVHIGQQLDKVDDNDIGKILAIFQNNPELMGDFISDIFDVKEVKVYPIPNYGSAMAPIYSVLALWVGGLILTSIFKTHVPKFEGSDEISIRQKYYGKMLTFVVFGVIQGLIIALGNIFMLNVHTVNPFLMVLFSTVSSAVFTLIIYTNVSLLGEVGKAVNIVFMILQLAGCGGSYPIEVDPLIFRILQPLFPFTYAVGGFRESIAGPLPSSVALDFIMLFVFAAIYIILGFIFKPKLQSHVKKFETKFEESGLGE